MKKKNKSLLLTLLFFLSSIQNFIDFKDISSLEVNYDTPEVVTSAHTAKEPFIVGLLSGPLTIDPQDAWDESSWHVIDQVCEGLYMYDLKDPDCEIIPNLASSYGIWSIDGLEYTVPLITNATFHDGEELNATTVKSSFDRLFYLCNHTGLLGPSDRLATLHTIYEFQDGTPIINRIEIINDFTIKFVLNKPFAALLALLCFPGSYILSPVSTPAMDFIDINTGDLVGTGPFVYDEYISDTTVSFHSYDNYWRGQADFDIMNFSIIDDWALLNQSFLDGDIHFLTSFPIDYIDGFYANSNITVLDYGKTSAELDYLCMNNKVINQTFRQAISYAINYSFIVDDFYKGTVVRAGSPVPQGMVYSNWTNNYATFDIPTARMIMQSMGFGLGWDTAYPGTNEAEWTSASFATFNYSYNTGNWFRSELYTCLHNNLSRIGIEVLDGGTSWEYFIWRAYGYVPGGYDDLQLFWIGWVADYNDPSNFINSLFYNTSISNAAQVNDPYLQDLMDQGYEERDSTLRKQIYDEIQRYLVEDLMPWAWGYCPKMYDAHHIDLSGYQQNSMRKLYFYPCRWNRNVYETEVSKPDDITYTEGTTGNEINWTITAENVLNPVYYIYNSTGLVKTDTWTSGLPIFLNLDGLSYGTHTYYIEVHNENIVLYDYVEVNVLKQRSPITFVVGTSSGFTDLDPHRAWDTRSYTIIDQVCEGLYTYDLNDPNCAIIPNLASTEGIWSIDGLEYTVPLIINATFHDGTKFNAAAVQFSFNRLRYFLNHTGQITDSNQISPFRKLYEFEDGTPIINSVEIINEYTIKFVLNRPYAALPALLCFPGSYILSPMSTPPFSYLDKNTDDLVGTGPFMYDGYIDEMEVYFHAFDNYWKGKADIDEMYFVMFDDFTARHDALSDGTIHFIIDPSFDYLDTFKADPDLTVLDYGETEAEIWGLVMNTKQINQTFRQAISYAINYSFIIEDLQEGNGVRLGSPVPQGIQYSNYTNNYATFNIQTARVIMQSMGFGVGWDTTYPGTDEALWTSASFASFTYNYNVDNQFRTDMYTCLYNNLSRIGIEVLDGGTDWAYFAYRAYGLIPGGYDDLQLFWIGWGADFNDPSDFIDNLFSNESIYNQAQVNDPYLQNLIEQGIEERDPTLRKQIYDEMQRYLVEELMPWAWGYSQTFYDAYHKDLSGYQQNPMRKVYFYPCQWARDYPGSFNLTTDAKYPDRDGNFNLNWEISEDAANYTVYEYSSYITEINSSLTPLLIESTNLILPLSGYSDGTYYFIVVAHNNYGNTTSNCIEVYVRFPQPPGAFNLYTDADPIDDDGIFNLNWDVAEDAANYTVYEHSTFITEINISVTPILIETKSLSLPLSGYTNGTYFFIVVAFNNFGNISSNCIDVVVELPPLGPFNLYSDADPIDDDGIFTLNWDVSQYAINYTVYEHSSYITEINGSLTPKIEGTTSNSLPLYGYTDGTYFFIVVAYNDYSNRSSNCVRVVVQLTQPPGPFNLYSDADPIDDDGIFTLNWDESEGAIAYYVYEYSSYITEINGSLTPLLTPTTDLSLALSGYTDGTYFFICVAYNSYGQTLSNCIKVIVQIPQPPGSFNLNTDADPIDNDGTFNLNWGSSDGALNYTVYEYSSYITMINGSLTPLLEGTTTRSLALSGYTDGTYYFIVVAYNNYGQTMSNNVKVVVQIPSPSPPGIPGYSIYLLICALSVASITLAKKRYFKILKS